MPREKLDRTKPHPDHPDHWHISYIAELIDLGQRQIQNLARAGTLPKSVSGGFYPLKETVRAYVQHQRKNPPGEKRGEASRATIGVVEERHRKYKIENDVREGKLVRLDQVEAMLTEMATTLSNLLDGAAGRMAGGDAVLRNRLLNEHRRIRSTFADRLEAFVDAQEGGAGAPAAARKNGRRVGRSKASTREG